MKGSDTMAQTSINIRMDEELKQDFDNICSALGISMTTAFNIFAEAVVVQQGIPFPIALDAPNAETLMAITEVQQMKRNPSLYKSYANFSELLKEMEKDV